MFFCEYCLYCDSLVFVISVLLLNNVPWYQVMQVTPIFKIEKFVGQFHTHTYTHTFR
jgi:hypothetical protein